MNEMQQKLNKIYNLVAAVPVSGDAVEIMASARALLRETFKDAETKLETQEKQNG